VVETCKRQERSIHEFMGSAIDAWFGKSAVPSLAPLPATPAT
jgi:hypothetical protein